jgi:hypothetical protein
LGGTGTVAGPVTVSANATLAAAIGAVGTFNINNDVTLLSGAVCSMKVNQGSATNDVIQGIGHLTYGGTLVVTNLSGTLAAGDSFPLFSAAIYSGSFAAVNPPTPGTGLAWDTTQLATSGTLKVATGVNPNPTNLTVSVSGGNLVLSWPADHTGWTLQSQTNSVSAGLGKNWVDWTGSTGTNSLKIPLTTTNGCVFFRLKL